MTLLSLNRGGILGLMLTLFLFGLPLRAEKGRVMLLPTPNVVRLQSDSLRFNCGDRLRIKADEEALAAVRLWNSTLPATSNIRMDITRRKRADIHFVKDTTIPHEGYSLSVTPRGITVSAAGHAGFVYAVQTLRQLTSTDKGLALPCLEISDAPRVGWRSLMLDSGRQYQRVETLKKYIDLASMLKMNYFHWHLTEGLGWRVEIKRYPRLTSVGAFVADGPEQQGFYTQQDIREIVRYAQERAVTVVPEIDMPGHAEAALMAYPELGCPGVHATVPKAGFTSALFCAGRDSTLAFLRHVLDEVCDLFPSPYIHLGGDEAPKAEWDRCCRCQTRIDSLGLRDSHDLQRWFSNQMANYLARHGRKAIFWGDVVYQPGVRLADNSVIQWWNWRGHKDLALRRARELGHPVICGTNYYSYLNFPTSPWRGYAADRTFGLREAYTNNPSYLPEADSLVLGMSCALWTDYGLTENLLDSRLMPRILALAEQMWHQGPLMPWPDFQERVETMRPWFEAQGYRYGSY